MIGSYRANLSGSASILALVECGAHAQPVRTAQHDDSHKHEESNVKSIMETHLPIIPTLGFEFVVAETCRNLMNMNNKDFFLQLKTVLV